VAFRPMGLGDTQTFVLLVVLWLVDVLFVHVTLQPALTVNDAGEKRLPLTIATGTGRKQELAAYVLLLLAVVPLSALEARVTVSAATDTCDQQQEEGGDETARDRVQRHRGVSQPHPVLSQSPTGGRSHQRS